MPGSTLMDAQKAWSPFEPSANRPWDVRAAAHLYRRAGFAAPWSTLEAATQTTPGDAVRELVEARDDDAATAEFGALTRAMVNTGEARSLSGAWLHRMLQTRAPLLEKTTLFWHGHFATSGDKVTDPRMLVAQHQLLRREALGSFAVLAHEISRDPAMLIYLDSVTNRKAHPNENYARELLELFCLGEGRYSERDIREIARCFTGWQVKRNKFRFNRFDHDSGEKSFFGSKGRFGGDEAVDVVLAHDAAPYFIAEKLVRFFVMDELPPERSFLEPIADTLRRSEWRIAPAVRQILSSNVFFSDAARGAKIRSPIEFACGFLRSLDGSANGFKLAEWTDRIGQALFFPPNVKGWDGGRDWVNTSTLVGRANLVHDVLSDENTRFAGGRLDAYFDAWNLSLAERIERLESLLLAVPLSDPRRRALIQLGSDTDADGQPAHRLLHALASTPEFQLS